MPIKKLSLGAVLALLTVSRISAFLLDSFPCRREGINTADLLAVLLGGIAAGVLFLPSLVGMRRSGGALLAPQSLPCQAVRRTAWGIYGAYLMLAAFRTVAQTGLFLKVHIFSLEVEWLFAAFILVFAAFSAMQGITGIGRAAPVMLTLVAIAVLILLLSSLPLMDTLWVTSPLWYGASQTAFSVADTVAQNAELVLFPLLLTCVRESDRSRVRVWPAVLGWTVAGMTVLLNILLVCSGSDGGQLFPYYQVAAVVTSKNGISPEAVLVGFWLLSVFLRVTLLLNVSVHCFIQLCCDERRHTNRSVTSWYRLLPWGLAGVLIVCEILFTVFNRDRAVLFEPKISLLITLSVGVLLPLILILFTKKKPLPQGEIHYET